MFVYLKILGIKTQKKFKKLPKNYHNLSCWKKRLSKLSFKDLGLHVCIGSSNENQLHVKCGTNAKHSNSIQEWIKKDYFSTYILYKTCKNLKLK